MCAVNRHPSVRIPLLLLTLEGPTVKLSITATSSSVPITLASICVCVCVSDDPAGSTHTAIQTHKHLNTRTYVERELVGKRRVAAGRLLGRGASGELPQLQPQQHLGAAHYPALCVYLSVCMCF